MAVRSSSTCTALITVLPAEIAEFGPEPSVNAFENDAVAVCVVFSVSPHDGLVPLGAQAPPHCLNVAPAPAVAVNVTTAPVG